MIPSTASSLKIWCVVVVFSSFDAKAWRNSVSSSRNRFFVACASLDAEATEGRSRFSARRMRLRTFTALRTGPPFSLISSTVRFIVQVGSAVTRSLCNSAVAFAVSCQLISTRRMFSSSSISLAVKGSSEPKSVMGTMPAMTPGTQYPWE